MDAFRAAYVNNPSFLPYANRVASLNRPPMQQRIQRILVPFPS